MPTFLADARITTDGAVVELRAPRGYSPPLQINHREDEELVVLAGELTVCSEGELYVVGAGDSAHFPRGAAHTFVVESDGAHLRTASTRAGIERLHVALGAPAPGPLDLVRYARVAEIFGITLVGPPLAPCCQAVCT